MFPIMGSSSPSGYNLTRSLRFRASASGYLSRSAYPVASAGTQWTMSMWVKRGTLGTLVSLFSFVGTGGAAQQAGIQFDSNNNIRWWQYAPSAYQFHKITTAVFRDPSAWYQLVFIYDTTLATASDRCQIWVNGVRQTSFSTSVDPSLNLVTYYKTGQYFPYLGAENRDNAYFGGFDGYLAEVNFIDGQALTPSSFGSTNALTGVWQPAAYTGSYGTNGFELNFTDNSALTTASNVGLGKDFSGNANYWVTNNISITAGVTYDSMTDVPTLTSATAANFAVLNPIGNGSGTISNGNLRAVTSTTLADVGTFAMQSGKWYWEVTLTVSSNPRVGMYDIGKALPTAVGMGGTNSWAIINGPSRLYYQGTIVAYGSFVGSSGSVVMIAYDPTNGNLWFGENGSWFASGNPATGASPSLTGVTGTAIVAAAGSGSGSNTFDYNFGQRPFTYTAPTGYVALNTYNLPTSTIVKGNTVMDATLYTGNGSTQTITNAAAFKPDLVWVKTRSSGSFGHALFDSVRGAPRRLASNLDEAENTTGSFGQVSSFNSTGFTVATGSSSFGETGANALTYVGWQWQAGQGTSSSNTNGTITSTVSVNTSAGFSVVTYTGTGANATVGHGLGVAPSFIIVKIRDTAGYLWLTYHSSVGASSTTYLNSTSASAASSSWWNNTAPTSSVFTVGTSNYSNQSSKTYVAYCWTPIAGFSAFGSYTGNGSTDGTFVYTGFRPKFVLIKRTDTTGDWRTIDTSRDTYNGAKAILYPNLSDAEASVEIEDILSNGFKLRINNAGINGSGGTYIYMAYAENPFKNALAR